jgi:hypothetical protein
VQIAPVAEIASLSLAMTANHGRIGSLVNSAPKNSMPRTTPRMPKVDTATLPI